MESEGLYRYEHRDEQKAFVVVGPGRENMGGTYTKNEASIAARLANLAYAEGRKAAEKEQAEQKCLGHTAQDFRELLHLASVMSEVLKETPYSTRIVNIFVDWKKARGLV